MERTIAVSEQIYLALQRQATRSHKSINILVESWLKQHLDLERYPELEWREGPGGWRVGVKGTAIDVYTVVGYSQAGYSPQKIADELLPRLDLEQVQAALRYYAEYPDEIDRILVQGEAEAVKAQLYRSLGPEGYRRLTSLSGEPRAIREARARYEDNGERTDEHD
ncbi:MAG: hypothetical protein Kow0063_21040 [Anaerolineae bacterium]